MNLTRIRMKLEHTTALRCRAQAQKGYTIQSFTVLSLILEYQGSLMALSILGPLFSNPSGQSLHHDEF